MLEKIGLPARPSLRGNTWVLDASHCQGCSSQFTFINRKHHCRRCGGIFCNSCTQQRMVLRGQGDSPVRICQPCKQLEEAARFEMRYGNKNRAPSRGSTKLVSKNDQETLNRILGNDANSNGGSFSSLDGGGEVSATNAVDETDLSSISPEELRKQALDEKKRYKILKGEGKSGEAMKAFKRGKELERQADALEISVRKSRRKVSSSGNMLETHSNDGAKESGGKSRGLGQVGKEKDDICAELRDLGWNEMDLHAEDKRSANMSLEGELSSLLGDVSRRASKDSASDGIGKAPVVEHKRKALMLKREGKLAEAKEELKKAKVLEKQLEEQEILGGAEDSDDEISALIRSMDDDKDDDLVDGYRQDHGFDLDHLMSTADNLDDKNLEVTDDDMMDPEIGAALKSLGWTDDSNNQQVGGFQSHFIERDALLHEIRSLKREALNQKQAGNVAEAMAQLKKAKLLERELESFEGGDGNMVMPNSSGILKGSVSQNIPQKKDAFSQFAPKNRLMIQKELLVLKKKALALRRDGRLDEAEEELRKGRVLEQELQEMDNATKVIATHQILEPDNSDSHEIFPVMQGEEDVTDQDMRDPTYLSLLRTMGWKEDEESASSQMKHSGGNGSHSIEVNEPSARDVTGSLSLRTSSKSKGEMQRELLALKRKALALRREGKTDESEEVLSSAKVLEFQMAETESPLDKRIQVEFKGSEGDNKFASTLLKPAKEYDHHSLKTMEPSITDASSSTPSTTLRSKGELQRELLGLKRKALALRREGKTDEAEDVLLSAKALETQMEASRNATQVEVNRAKAGSADSSIPSEAEKGDADDVTDEDMIDPAFLSVLKNLGWKEEASQPATVKVNASKNVSVNSVHSHPSVISSPSSISAGTQSGKEDQQDEVGWKDDPSRNLRIKDKLSSASDASHQGQGTHAEALTSSPENQGTRVNVAAKMVERVVTADEKLGTFETKSQGYASQNDQSTLRREVLAHKRKAVALKREGKLSEAREELRQAKLLEKSLEAENPNIEQGTSTATSTSVSTDSVPEKDIDTSKPATKPLSGRDRFKLQQESLSHKRQALKLRREGRMEEAEAEFKLAKALEVQLEETASQSSASSSAGIAEPVDDVVVEDLLDPQLLSALKSIGIADTDTAPTGEERPAPVKVDLGKVEHDTKEKIQLEEQIKAEKIKAVNLKRAGKQAEALEALRRAKLFGKKLNSLS